MFNFVDCDYDQHGLTWQEPLDVVLVHYSAPLPDFVRLEVCSEVSTRCRVMFDGLGTTWLLKVSGNPREKVP